MLTPGIVHLAAVPGLASTSPEFRRALVGTAERLGLHPDALTPTMSRESGFRPEAINPTSHAVGLIQFMPPTARRLGTSTEALQRMSAEEQLPFVEAYYRPLRGRLASPGEVYVATFMPAYLGKPDSTVIAASDSLVYTQNPGLDADKDGHLTVGEVRSLAEKTLAAARSKPPIPVDRSPAVAPSEPLRPSAASSLGPLLFGMVVMGGAAWLLQAQKTRPRR